MAPDSGLWSHPPGEATSSFRHILLKVTIPVCLLLSLSTSDVQARSESIMPPGDESVAVVAVRDAEPAGSMTLASLSPPARLLDASPAGRWRDRIQIPIAYQPSIQKYISSFEDEERATFADALSRAWPLLPAMSELLESHGVPAELIAVVLVESRFKKGASCRGACGYWQLMAATAGRMGLRVDHAVDERRDPIKSTEAAAKYLRSLYDRYHCWGLALAAYNAGDGPVNKAVRGSGKSNYWDVARQCRLPHRTRAYVPRVFAAAAIMRNLGDYGFKSPKNPVLYDFEPVKVKGGLNLDLVAKWVGVSPVTMEDLNPSLRSGRTPSDPAGFTLRLPSGSRDRFDQAYEAYARR